MTASLLPHEAVESAPLAPSRTTGDAEDTTLAFLEHLFDDGSVEDNREASWRYWQEVLNGDFPPAPVPAENVAEPIPVVARVVWEKDGEEHIECTAIRWTRTHVLVDLGRDRRCSTIGAWLLAEDVRRRG